MTIADVLSDVKRQLDWRGSTNDIKQGHVVLTREQAEYLHQWAIDLCLAKDNLEEFTERLSHQLRSK
jgi:hypothetical protein